MIKNKCCNIGSSILWEQLSKRFHEVEQVVETEHEDAGYDYNVLL